MKSTATPPKDKPPIPNAREVSDKDYAGVRESVIRGKYGPPPKGPAK